MTTTPIPDDIMQTALRIANRKDVLSLTFETREALSDDIAQAIHAARIQAYRDAAVIADIIEDKHAKKDVSVTATLITEFEKNGVSLSDVEK